MKYEEPDETLFLLKIKVFIFLNEYRMDLRRVLGIANQKREAYTHTYIHLILSRWQMIHKHPTSPRVIHKTPK